MVKRSQGSMATRLFGALGALTLVAAGVLWAKEPRERVAFAAPVGVARHADPTRSPDAAAAPDTVDPSPVTGAVAGAVPPVGGLPHTLHLGRTSVDLDPVGIAADGGIDIPDNPSRAGWWAAGSAPGDPQGSTVLVGHLDSAKHGLGAFASLLTVRLGDPVTVVDSTGATYSYVVTGRVQITKTALPSSLFTTQGPARLLLVTCGGRFDPVTHHYDDNVIVTAEPRDAP